MNKVIYKWGPISNLPVLNGIKGRVVHVGYQEGPTVSESGIYVWTECFLGEDSTERFVDLYPTGAAYTSEDEYLGTVIMPSTGLVWHVVEHK